MKFADKLNAAWAKNRSALCVGLDPDLSRIPASFLAEPEPIYNFNKAIIDATSRYVCAFKPQIAFYSALEAEDQLKKTIAYIRSAHPGLLVILDAKRNDIGSTAVAYASEAFIRYDADAVTVNPLLGFDSIEPFTATEDRGAAVLCRTSNPGAADLQELQVDKNLVFSEYIARLAATAWNERNNVMLVVGATYPESIKKIREIAPHLAFLVPGIGAQDGDLESVVRYGKWKHGNGLVISASRSVLYAGKGENCITAAAKEAERLFKEAGK